MDAETFVLVVGGGPVGLAAAIELAWRCVPAILVNDGIETAQHPKCNNTNARSMEHFRRLGIADELRCEGLPPHIARASAYVTRFCGHELGRLPRPYSDWPTPEIPNNVSQIVLERVLRRCAERQIARFQAQWAPVSRPESALASKSGARSDAKPDSTFAERAPAQIHFGWRLNSFVSRHDHVIAEVEDLRSGTTQKIRARFLLGVDGASSTVRRALGFGMIGEDGTTHRAFMGGTMLSFFIRSPTLLAASKRPPTNMTWIINPEMRGMMYSQDGLETWVVHYQVPPGMEWRDVDGKAVIAAMIGADVDFKIISGGPWTGGLALVAEHYQSEGVLLAGDAAHLFTPLGGLGMNTGIGDVMNLCWKLAAVHQGWAGSRLIESYEIERRPMGIRNSELGVRCTRIMDGWIVPPDFEQDSAQAFRRAFGARIMEEDRAQYLTVGIQLGERYETSPVIWPDGSAEPPDCWDSYSPLDRPGARAPHFWLAPGRAVYDELGKAFTVLDFGAAGGAAALAMAAQARGVPLTILRLERPASLYRSRLVLVRPDQHIAWHGDVVADAAAIIDRVRGA
jgi:2-polyprenyl-6-methoxyphenol hydroxylase-like FAD-dependent oxidoreductase